MTLAKLLQDCVGAEITCSKTVAESDIMLFAGITGDFSPNHVDEELMRNTRYGGRIAHGALLVGYMSRASTLIADRCGPLMERYYPVSLGYDRVRFLQGVRIGNTLTIRYRISEVDCSKFRTLGSVSMTNENGQDCAAATHVMSWLAR
jgi:3-hydroxybutyryl-CoA dehydratase